MAAAPILPAEAVAEAAATQGARLVLLQGGLSATGEAGAGAAVLGTEAVGGGAAAVGGGAALEAGAVGGGAALGAGAIAATAGIALVVIGLGALGYYLYKKSHDKKTPSPPSKPRAVNPCPPGNPTIIPRPNITPKPVPRDKRIPDKNKAEEIARKKEQKYEQRCKDLWDSIDRRTNTRRTAPSADLQGVKYRFWDNICSEKDPSTPEGSQAWDAHQQAYENDRKGLQRDINEFTDNCDGDLPPGAEEWAKKPYPDKSQWRGNTPECEQYRRERQQRYDQYKNNPNP